MATGFLSGGGNMGALMRAHDWAASPLGSPETWPESLKAVVALMVSSRYPMFVAWGPSLAFLYNDDYAPILGKKHATALGRPFAEVWADIWDDIGPLADRALAGESTFAENLHLVMDRHGFPEDTWYSFSYSPVRDESGAVAGMFCACSETTSQVLNDRRQVADRDRLALMFEKAPGFITILKSPEHVFEIANAAYRNLFGDRDFVGRTAREVFPELEGQGFFELLDSVYSSGERFVADQIPIQLAGETRFLDFIYEPLTDETGKVTGIFVEGHDVTAARNAEAALRASAEQLEQKVARQTAERNRVWEMSRDLFATVGFDGRLKIINPAWETTFGRDQASLLATPFRDTVHPDDKAAVAATMERLRRGDTVTRFEDRIRHADGSWRWISWTLVPEDDVFYAVGRDVTAEKAAAAELEGAQAALRQAQKMDAMGQLTGGVAHDFNNLLTPIVGGLDMLQRRGLGNEREQRLIAGAMQSADRAKTLVQRLLAFARRQPLQPSAVDVGQLVNGMADLLASTTGPQIQISISVPDDLPPARADPNQLEMALLNLGVNARDAMPTGGVLRITVMRDVVSRPKGELRAGDYICLSVADTGSGMDEATLARAVEPFFSTKGIGKGTGLGLSMVHGLAAQLGGALTMQSRPDLGTNVRLWLPVSTGPVEHAPVERRAGSAHSARGLVLLVDDEDGVRTSTAAMLIDLGYDVREAESAEVAMAVVRDGLRPAVLVTDHLMPGMTGVDLVDAIRDILPDLPTLIVSGYAEVEGLPPTLPRLAKPFKAADLAASLSVITAAGGGLA